LGQHKIKKKKMDDGMERVRFIGTGMVKQLAHVQPTRENWPCEGNAI
jgi:hypothetical protein